jgi:hypothetical protein
MRLPPRRPERYAPDNDPGPSPAAPANPHRIDFSGDDQVGQRFVYDLKNELARSAIYEYDPSGHAGFVLIIVSLTPYEASLNNQMTAVLIALTMNMENQPYWYLGNWALICGANHTEGLAKKMVGVLDSDVDQLKTSTAANNLTCTLFGLAILAALVTPGFADDTISESGLQFVQHCRAVAHDPELKQAATNEELFTAVSCIGYSRGLLDGLIVANAIAEHDGWMLYKLPEKITAVQAMLVTVAYIDRHPEKTTRADGDLDGIRV